MCRRMAAVFRLPYKPGNSSDFAGTAVECMKSVFLGKNGHIGFRTNCCERARAYFESLGIGVREETCKRDDSGWIKSFYLDEEIGGFAVHVMK